MKCHMEVPELWVKELLKSRVKMRTGSLAHIILLGVLELAGYLCRAPYHAAQIYSDFFAALGI